ncbi:hypothetical protein SAMN04487970_104352 [Paenibacillus tianmuensis]|uniref:Uncharacterized protein n=1 Tax=Paenibacillus tianmuensis TaxID=624147 RepID=A0A1G4T7Z5_9BACL|nr:hypothetical protein SAMN04487970_104352 [Paenibacillus tianmuensis]
MHYPHKISTNTAINKIFAISFIGTVPSGVFIYILYQIKVYKITVSFV